MSSITIEVKNVYGNETIYPVCEQAKLFAQMVEQKTLTKRDLSFITALGYNVKVENASSIHIPELRRA